jgi:hypothetical protein
MLAIGQKVREAMAALGAAPNAKMSARRSASRPMTHTPLVLKSACEEAM